MLRGRMRLENREGGGNARAYIVAQYPLLAPYIVGEW